MQRSCKSFEFNYITLIIAVGAGIGSQILLSTIFGGEQVTTSVQTLQLENYAKRVSVENESYLVEDAKYLPEENAWELIYGATTRGFAENEEVKAPMAPAPFSTRVSKEAYDTAKQTPETVTVFKETESKTESPSFWPLSASLGVAASLIFVAIWMSKQEARGSATGMLLEKGLKNMSVRDAEIVGEIMRREEFTIPELMQKAGTSKITTWRTVKKLVKKGLVRETDETRAPSKGLEGRGKPSQVYKYIGPEEGGE